MEEDRQRKLVIMKIGVAVAALIIFAVWFLNFRHLWQSADLAGGSKQSELSRVRQEISQSIKEAQTKMSEAEKQEKLQSDADKLLEDLVNEAEKIASSSTSTAETELASSTASTTIESPGLIASSSTSSARRANCPAYIDCMPTIGEARPCQIPVGCEGFTQIAY